MIIHKLIASSIAYPKLFILSPNIRIEKAERAKTGKHIYEFSQFDFEIRNASSKDVMKLVENTIYNLVESLHKDMKEDYARTKASASVVSLCSLVRSAKAV